MKTYPALKKMAQRGFTLVELLIVIALIGILSVAVLATINPIEQTNKARDAKFRNDAAEVLSAYERYYSAQNEYPWNAASVGISAGYRVAIGSSHPGFGVLGAGGVGSTDGALIVTSELKSAFTGKDMFKAGAQLVDQMYAYNNGIDSNYVCYCPKARANKTGAIATQLKCISGTLMTQGGATLLNIGDANCVAPPATGFTDAQCLVYTAPAATDFANMLCVPDGTIISAP